HLPDPVEHRLVERRRQVVARAVHRVEKAPAQAEIRHEMHRLEALGNGRQDRLRPGALHAGDAGIGFPDLVVDQGGVVDVMVDPDTSPSRSNSSLSSMHSVADYGTWPWTSGWTAPGPEASDSIHAR